MQSNDICELFVRLAKFGYEKKDDRDDIQHYAGKTSEIPMLQTIIAQPILVWAPILGRQVA